MKHKHREVRKTVAVVTIIVFIMFSFTFVLAPLYNAICRVSGLNGKVNLTPAQSVSQQAPIKNRDVTMQFVTTLNQGLAWDFYPQKTSIEVHPEENAKMLFFVKNNTDKTVTVQAIPSITPWQAAAHLHKVQCFCFSQQTLKPGESLSMPVVFRLDKDLPSDIKTVTLSYTLFDVSKQKRKTG